jgi:hypothetical protein
MKRYFAAILWILATLSSSVLALDLTPRETVLNDKGPLIRRYFFQDTDKRLSFRIDSEMTVTGSADAATFHFTDLKNSSTKLMQSSVTPQGAFDEKNLDLYRKAARALISAEAKDVKAEEAKSDAVIINGWTSLQFTFTYTLFGFPYRQSVTFINCTPTEQLIFDVMAPESDYAKTYRRSYLVLNSISDYAPNENGPT